MSSPIWLSDHAVKRYRSRLCPQLDKQQARRRLLASLPRLNWSDQPPAWIADTPSSLNAVAYLVDGERFALPLRAHRRRPGLIAPTCLTPGLPRPDRPWVSGEDLRQMQSLLRFSGVKVVAPWRRVNRLPNQPLARSDLYRQACLSRLGDKPSDIVSGELFLWLPGGGVLCLNRRPGGFKASALALHDQEIVADPEICRHLADLREKPLN